MMKRLARLRVPLGFLFAGLVLWLAQPTPRTLLAGAVIALLGEGIRIWAAGHLEKGREVTSSGPYALTRHPLYLGSSVIAAGVMLASNSLVVALAGTVYMVVTINAAIRTEEAFLRQAFGDTYDRYQRAEVEPMRRRFSLGRALRNREYRAVAGLCGGFALLALKVVLPI